MGTTVNGLGYGNNTLPTPTGRDERTVQEFLAAAKKVGSTAQERYAAAQEIAKHAHDEWDKKHDGP